MDALLAVAVEEIALEGLEGCTVDTLWSLLGIRLPVGSITCLPPQLQDILWGLLLLRTEDVLFFTVPSNPPTNPVDESPEPGPKKGRSTRPKKKVENNPMARVIMLSTDDPKIRTHASAAENGVMIAASEAVRMSVLGVYEIQDSRFPLSDMQLAALAAVGRTRWRGIINADLANNLGIAYRNFYYIVKNLETRKLVVKNPVVFAPPGATVTVSSVLHLPRFQPAVKLGPGQMFKTVDAVRGMEVATYVLQDDNMYMRLVCSTIAETAERVVVESDLKLVCGFRGTRGHRLWRRLRRKMEEQGYLAFETCRVRDRLVPCVRLLKDWKPPTGVDKEDPEGVGEGDEADGEDIEGGTNGRAGFHVTELSLERQLLEGVLSSGSEGVLNHELFSRLGVSSKVYGTKLVDIIKRYNLQVTVVNRGRTVLNRLVAPPELLAAAQYLQQATATTEQDAMVGTPAPARCAKDVVHVVAASEGAGPSLTNAAPRVTDAALVTTTISEGTLPAAAAAAAAAGKAYTAEKSKRKGTGKGTVKSKGAAKVSTTDAAVPEATPAGRPRRVAAVKASEGAAAALKALGGVTADDRDDEYDVEADAEPVDKKAESSSGSGDEVDEELSEEKEAELKRHADGGASNSGRGGVGAGGGCTEARPMKRLRVSDVLGPPPMVEQTGTEPAHVSAPAQRLAELPGIPTVAVAATLGAAAAGPGTADGAAATSGVVPKPPKERKPHWTKVITLKTEDRLRLLVEHLNNHRFISRVQVRRLVMEWESAASGKPIPNSTAGPDIKTIRRLMDRLAQSGKAKLVRVETPGFLGDNRPIDTLLRPDLEPTPELMDEIRKHMAEFERKLRSECCRKALAARKMATTIHYPVGNLLPEAVIAAAAAAGSATAAAVVAAEAAEANHAAGGSAIGQGSMEALDEATDGLLRAAGLHSGNDELGPQGAATDGGRKTAGGHGEATAQQQAVASSDAVRLRIGRGVSLFRAVHNEATARSVENGLIPAKMVRVRLLHFLIAKLVGLGGFEADPLASVDPDPAGMPHMPLSLGEEVLSLASATERSKMAFAFGAMKGTTLPGDQQRQQLQGQAQAHGQGGAPAEGLERGVAVGGDAAPGGTTAAGPGTGTIGQDTITPLRHLSVRRLWSIMPLSVALQVLGSTSRRPPEELARLCEGGATLGSLTPEQARNIMDGTSVHRLEYLISILRRLRLLEWAVVDRSRLESTRRIGPGAGVRARDGHGVRLLVHGRGVLEVPPGKEVTATGTGAGGLMDPAPSGSGGNPPAIIFAPTGFSGMQGGSGRFVEVDLSTAAGLDEYWRRFEELYRLTGTAHAEVQRLRRCFPATTVPEVLSRNSWHGQRLMTAVQWLKLQAGLEHIDLADGQQITSLAAQLGIDVDVVARIVSDKRRRMNRAGDPAAEGGSGDEDGSGAEGVPLRLARLNTGAALRGQGQRQGQGQGTGGNPIRSSHGADEALPAGERRRIMKRRTMRRSSPTARQRRAEEREADRVAKAARKAARTAKRAEREAAKAERRAARAAGTYVVRRRTRAEIEAAGEAAGQPQRKRQRLKSREDRTVPEAAGAAEGQAAGGKERQRRKRPPPPPLSAAQLAARDDALLDLGPSRQRILVAPFVSHEGDNAAGVGSSRQRRSSDNNRGDGGEMVDAAEDGTATADGGMGPRMRMPNMAAPSRVTRILWTASEDRVLLTEYVKLAADTGPNVRLPWKSRSSALPYSITVCIRHIRYLKRHYPSYTGRLDELIRRAFERKVDLARLAERGHMRLVAYRERLRRRQAGEPVNALGEDGLEVLEEAKLQPMPPRDPLEVTRAIVTGTTSGEVIAGVQGIGDGTSAEIQLSQQTAEQEMASLSAAAATATATVAAAPAVAVASAIPVGADTRRGPPPVTLLPSVDVGRPGDVATLSSSELVEDPAEAMLLQRAAEADATKARLMVMEREAVIAEALALVEDFVLVMPRRVSQKKREMMQQRGDLDLGEMPAETVAEAQGRRRTASAVRRSLVGALQASGSEAAITGGGGSVAAGISAGAAGTTTVAAPASAAPARGRRIIGGIAGRVVLPVLLAPTAVAFAQPSVAVTAAMCMLMSLLYKVRAAGGVAAWMSSQVVETLTDFGRRFSIDTKTAALKQMQLRGWLARTGPRRQLELTQAFVNRLQGTELPHGLLGRCASAAARLDELLAHAATAANDPAGPSAQHHGGNGETDEMGVDGIASPTRRQSPKPGSGLAPASAVPDVDRTGTEAVERTCTVDTARGALVLEAQEQLPSELVAIVLTRQALGLVELLPSAVDAQSEWGGQAATAGMSVTSVQLIVVPQHASSRPVAPAGILASADATARGGRGVGSAGAAGESWCAAVLPPSAGMRIVVPGSLHSGDVARSGPQGVSAAAAVQQRSCAVGKQHQHQQYHRNSGVSPGLLAHGASAVAASAVEVAGSFCPWTSPAELPSGVAPIFRPSAVASDPKNLSRALETCRAYLEGEVQLRPGLVEELLYAIEALLNDAGSDGLTFMELSSLLNKAANGGVVLSAERIVAAPPARAQAVSAQNEGTTANDGAAEAKPPSPPPPRSPPRMLMISLQPTQHHVSLALSALELHGLTRRVGGWDALHFIDVRHCQEAVVEVEITDAASMSASGLLRERDAGTTKRVREEIAHENEEGGQDVVDADKSSGRGRQGTSGSPNDDVHVNAVTMGVGNDNKGDADPMLGAPGVRERVLRPWVNYRGSVNTLLWDTLVQRLLGLVMRHPGISEELLVASLDVIPPQACRELLHHLAESGRVEVRTTVPVPRSRRPLLLRGGCSGSAERTAAPIMHYFPILSQYAGADLLKVGLP